MRFVIIFLLFISINSIVIFSQDNSSDYFSKDIDVNTSIEGIYSNINVMKNSIFTLRNKVKTLNNQITKVSAQNTELGKDLGLKISLNKEDIKNLQFEFNKIDVDYKTVIKKISSFELTMDSMFFVVDNLINELQNLKSNFMMLQNDYLELKNEFLKIPELYFCSECFPKLSISLSNNRNLTFNVEDIKATPSFSFDATYYDTENLGFWINYISPFFVTISTVINDNYSVSDHWSAQIFSGGAVYTYRPFKNNFAIRMGGGLFLGNAKFDKFMNSTIGFTRNGIKNANTYGLDLKAELSYTEYESKNPLEFFARANSLVAYERILLNPGLNHTHDLGHVLLFISFGVKFNFWGK